MSIFIAAMLASQLTPIMTAPSVPADRRPLSSAGSCHGGRRSVDIERVMFLENRTLVIDGARGPLRVSVEGENFAAEEIGESAERRTYAEPIDVMVQSDENLDIELKLALVDGQLALYWRETYRHRFYRQGVMSIDARGMFNQEVRGLRPLCEGEGGITELQ